MTRKIRRRSVLKGAAATAAVAATGKFVQPQEATAQFLTGVPVPSSPNFVMVTRGVSQAAIQVLKPTQDLVTTEVAGGLGVGGVGSGNNYDGVLNGNNLNFRGGISNWNDPAGHTFWDPLLGSVDGQYHTVFQATPANASGEVVTIITVGAAGDPYVPKTLAQAKAMPGASRLFADFVKGQRPFSLLSAWNTRIPYNTVTYTPIVWPAGGFYFTSWDDFSPGIYIGLPTDPLVTVTYTPNSWGNPSGTVNVNIPASTVTMSISGTTATVTGSPTSPVLLGMKVLSSTNGTTVGTKIVTPHLTGTGGAGTYTVDISQTKSSGTVVLAVDGAVGTDKEIVVINGTTSHNFWQFVRTGLTTATAFSYAYADVILDTGWGVLSPFHGAGIAAAGSNELGGLIIKEETDQGVIKHALGLRTDANATTAFSVIPPAISGDGQNQSGTGLFGTGQRLGIPPTTAMPGGLSPLGQIVFDCLVKYGCYVYDTTGGTYGFRADLLGYDNTTINAFETDNPVLIKLLQKVT